MIRVVAVAVAVAFCLSVATVVFETKCVVTFACTCVVAFTICGGTTTVAFETNCVVAFATDVALNGSSAVAFAGWAVRATVERGANSRVAFTVGAAAAALAFALKSGVAGDAVASGKSAGWLAADVALPAFAANSAVSFAVEMASSRGAKDVSSAASAGLMSPS
jgi:hypothetical protein